MTRNRGKFIAAIRTQLAAQGMGNKGKARTQDP